MERGMKPHHVVGDQRNLWPDRAHAVVGMGAFAAPVQWEIGLGLGGRAHRGGDVVETIERVGNILTIDISCATSSCVTPPIRFSVRVSGHPRPDRVHDGHSGVIWTLGVGFEARATDTVYLRSDVRTPGGGAWPMREWASSCAPVRFLSV